MTRPCRQLGLSLQLNDPRQELAAAQLNVGPPVHRAPGRRKAHRLDPRPGRWPRGSELVDLLARLFLIGESW